MLKVVGGPRPEKPEAAKKIEEHEKKEQEPPAPEQEARNGSDTVTSSHAAAEEKTGEITAKNADQAPDVPAKSVENNAANDAAPKQAAEAGKVLNQRQNPAGRSTAELKATASTSRAPHKSIFKHLRPNKNRYTFVDKDEL